MLKLFRHKRFICPFAGGGIGNDLDALNKRKHTAAKGLFA